jgi:hypothetical protein
MPEQEFYCTTCSGVTPFDQGLVNVVVACSACNEIMELREKEE